MNFKFKLSRRLAIALTLSVGCGVGAAGPQIDRIEGISITPGRLALQPFQSADLDLVVATSRGGAPDLASLTWRTTGGTVAINGIVGGVVRVTYTSPQQPGTFFFIVATTTGTPVDTASIGVTTTPMPVNAVAVSPGSSTIVAGDTVRLRVTLTDSTGAVVVGRATEFESSDQGVATVLASGVVRGVAAGSTTITASSEGHHGTATVTVTAAPNP